MSLDDLSTISEIAIGYSLLTVGTDTNESRIMRLRAADAARELGLEVTAGEIEKSLIATATTIEEVIPASLNVARLREYAPDTDEYPTVAS